MDAASTNPPEIPSKTESSAEAPQGFVGYVGTTEHVTVELDPPSPQPQVTYVPSLVREIAYQAAGAATGVVMRLHPEFVIPSNEVAQAVERVMAAFQVGP